MLAILAAATIGAATAAASGPSVNPRAFNVTPAAQACKSNGRYQIADRALLYRQDGKARTSALGALPKANHEKAVLRVVEGCTTPVVVGYEVGR